MKTSDYCDQGREDEIEPLVWALELVVLSKSTCIGAYIKEDFS